MRKSLGGLCGAAALALSIATVPHAQQAQQDTAPLTEAQTAGVKRLKEVIEVLNSGDDAKIRAYFEAQGEEKWLGNALSRHRGSRVQDSRALAVVRNKRTGHEQVLSVEIEPHAPHRITRLPWTRRRVEANVVGAAAPDGQSEQARLQEIGSYLKRLADADHFSGAVIIARDGKPVFAQAYGYADREKKIANTVDTPFLLGSMNKLFTGLAVGQLVEQGKLSYDDALSKFLPDYPDAESAKKIKIKHLLSHTSGLDSFNPADPAFSFPSVRTTNVQAVLDIAGKQPIKFEPGTRWAYSNTGMQVLGRVIEIVSGQDYYDYVRKNVYCEAG